MWAMREAVSEHVVSTSKASFEKPEYVYLRGTNYIFTKE